jgi:2-polyprenyl-3-methyl-5-hydroxy-6-metoxy-1,4-benzoquinol methylase
MDKTFFNDHRSFQSSDGISLHEELAGTWSDSYEKKLSFRKRLNTFKECLEEIVDPDELWLDAGCGTGTLSREIVYLGANVVAVDGSIKMIECAQRENQHISNSNLIFKLIDTVEKIDSDDDYFDGILCSSVIEYVDDPNVLIKEFLRILKPNGKLLISLPNSYSLVRKLQKIIRSLGLRLGKNYYFYLNSSRHDYSAREIKSLIQSSGFTIDSLTYFDPSLKLLSYLRLGSLVIVSAHKFH